jgi:hypothetical protein
MSIKNEKEKTQAQAQVPISNLCLSSGSTIPTELLLASRVVRIFLQTKKKPKTQAQARVFFLGPELELGFFKCNQAAFGVESSLTHLAKKKRTNLNSCLGVYYNHELELRFYMPY